MSFDPVSAAFDVVAHHSDLGPITCRDCGFPKAISDFRWRNDNKKYRTICKPCETSVHHQKYMRKRATISKEARIRAEADIVGRLLKGAKDTARRKKLSFNLDRQDIIVPDICPYLGTKITNVQGEGYCGTNASIDRVDPRLGYVRGNIQIISRRANSMKNDANAAELVFFARRVLLLAGER